MPNNYALNTLTLRDLRGHTGKVSFLYSYDPSAAADFLTAYTAVLAIINAVDALTVCQLVGVGGLASNRYSPNSYGGSGPYANAETKARLTFQVANPSTLSIASRTHIDIPAPVVAMFENDKETVNPAYGPMATLTAALLAVDAHNGQAVTRTGLIFTAFLGGTLVRRPFQRKINIYDKSANLDEPEGP